MFKSQHFAHKVFIKEQLQEWILCISTYKSHRALSFRCFSHLFPTYVIPSTDKRSVQQSNSIFVAAQWKHVPRKTRGTRLRIGCLILSCKVFLNELSPRQHLFETLWVGLDLHVRQIFEKELNIVSGRKVVCLCCFHNAVNHCAGFCAGRRVAEQPVLSADSTDKRGACYCFVARTPERQKLFYRISLVNAVCVKVGQVLS